MSQVLESTNVDRLRVRVFDDRQQLGAAAAEAVIAELRSTLAGQDRVRMVFAAAPSQSEFLDALVAAEGIDWSRVTAFHMDEYIGLPLDAPQRFGRWLAEHIFDRLPFGEVHVLAADTEATEGAEAIADAYAAALAEAPIDLVCMGIGVNGHIAFNDPPVADFDDPRAVKVAELDDVCRQQQVDDGLFASFDDVPERALTLTVPRLLDAKSLHCMVPGAAKAPAVADTLAGAIDESCPATALRTHDNCTVYLDSASAADAIAAGTLPA
ncbi:6-phosphogluconolactonase [Propionibacteriaceae bacterium Y2011]